MGAGTGRNLGYYPGDSTVNKIVLTDTSDKMLERAKEKLNFMKTEERERYEVVTADAANLTFEDNSFDTIVDSFGLCSFDDPVKVLIELQRVSPLLHPLSFLKERGFFCSSGFIGILMISQRWWRDISNRAQNK